MAGRIDGRTFGPRPLLWGDWTPNKNEIDGLLRVTRRGDEAEEPRRKCEAPVSATMCNVKVEARLVSTNNFAVGCTNTERAPFLMRKDGTRRAGASRLAMCV